MLAAATDVSASNSAKIYDAMSHIEMSILKSSETTRQASASQSRNLKALRLHSSILCHNSSLLFWNSKITTAQRMSSLKRRNICVVVCLCLLLCFHLSFHQDAPLSTSESSTTERMSWLKYRGIQLMVCLHVCWNISRTVHVSSPGWSWDSKSPAAHKIVWLKYWCLRVRDLNYLLKNSGETHAFASVPFPHPTAVLCWLQLLKREILQQVFLLK